MYKAIVVDDEEVPRQAIIDQLNRTKRFNIIGATSYINETIELLHSKVEEVDVLFLDINLYGGKCFEIIDYIKARRAKMPAIFLVTGQADFESAKTIINDYRDCVLTLLIKPFWHNWSMLLDDIFNKIEQNIKRQEKPSHSFDTSNQFYIRAENTTYLLNFEDIICLHSDYSEKSSGKTHLITTSVGNIHNFISLKKYESELLPKNFVRVSKYYIANMNYYDRFDHLKRVLYLKELASHIQVGGAYVEKIRKWKPIPANAATMR